MWDYYRNGLPYSVGEVSLERACVAAWVRVWWCQIFVGYFESARLLDENWTDASFRYLISFRHMFLSKRSRVYPEEPSDAEPSPKRCKKETSTEICCTECSEVFLLSELGLKEFPTQVRLLVHSLLRGSDANDHTPVEICLYWMLDGWPLPTNWILQG